MQARFNASKTIARPQFRELMFQTYFDPETQPRGIAVIRCWWTVSSSTPKRATSGTSRRSSACRSPAFYKKIDQPIEAFTGFNDNTPVTSYANAPEATSVRRRA